MQKPGDSLWLFASFEFTTSVRWERSRIEYLSGAGDNYRKRAIHPIEVLCCDGA